MKYFLLFIFIFFTHATFACTDFRLTAKDGTILISRSMEFAMDMQAAVVSSPRERSFTTTAADGKPGLSWKSKYGYLFLNGLQQDVVVDGFNEKGLSFEALLFPGEAQYQTVPAGLDNQALPYIYLGDWILGNFQTIDEVRQAISHITVFTQKIPGLGDMIFPLHFSIFDKSGKGIVVEYIAGKMQIHDSIGVMTNSPGYDFHVTNLRNYLNLSPYAPAAITAAGITFAGTGQGAGSVGLPGDSSPPSRFVKVSFLANYASSAANVTAAVNLAEHIMNNVDIPFGTVRAKQSNGADVNDYTQWVVFKDLTHRVLYYRTYQDLTVRSIAMDKIDLSPKAARLKMPLAASTNYIDMTQQFLSSK
jgi:choloylglycine hydrolase